MSSIITGLFVLAPLRVIAPPPVMLRTRLVPIVEGV